MKKNILALLGVLVAFFSTSSSKAIDCPEGQKSDSGRSDVKDTESKAVPTKKKPGQQHAPAQQHSATGGDAAPVDRNAKTVEVKE